MHEVRSRRGTSVDGGISSPSSPRLWTLSCIVALRTMVGGRVGFVWVLVSVEAALRNAQPQRVCASEADCVFPCSNPSTASACGMRRWFYARTGDPGGDPIATRLNSLNSRVGITLSA